MDFENCHIFLKLREPSLTLCRSIGFLLQNTYPGIASPEIEYKGW